MSSPEATVGPPGLAGLPGERRRRHKTPWLIAAAVVLVGAGFAVALADPFSSGGTTRPRVADPPSLQTVTRQDLSSQTQVSATLGYAGSYSVVDQALGTITSLPAVGQVVSEGQVLYQVSGAPVVLLYGATPVYRSPSEGTATELSGPDVAELSADLVALGYVSSSELNPSSDEFTSWTKVGVEKLQGALGVTRNGTLSLGQAVFEPAVATTPSGGGSPTITVLVNPTDSADTGTWDQAPVYVTITTGTVTNALVVPVDALLAQASGGYAVEVVGAEGIHRLEAVSLGLFDDADSMVQVTGAGLAAGQQVVVPNL